jgi:3-oxoacyl-[acyl-carrier protein] reductase
LGRRKKLQLLEKLFYWQFPKVAIITGASRGIGNAIATRLAQDGATVVINYSHSGDKAEATVRVKPKNKSSVLAQW